jgi:hypothetical protein
MSSQITTATNVQAPDLSNVQQNPEKFFNNFFSIDFSVGPSNDVLNAFFENFTGNKQSGQALAAAVLYTALAHGMDPMAVLAEFQQLDQSQISRQLAAFLNFNRVPTSLIGIKATPPVNNYVSRSIIP